MKSVRAVLMIALAIVLAGATFAWTAEEKEARSDVLYYCNCGPECKCNSVSTTPGKCKCGVDMKWGHVVKVEGNEALVCTCAEGCKCQGLDPKDPTKCSCGNPIKRIDLKGTGISFCNCGGSCHCNTVSDKPGKCKCGMDLKKVD